MENQMKITTNEMMNEVRALLRENIVGISRIDEEGKMQFRLPNGQVFKITVEEAWNGLTFSYACI